MDISENGRHIAERLLILLNDTQRQELAEYISHTLEQSFSVVNSPCAMSDPISPRYKDKEVMTWEK